MGHLFYLENSDAKVIEASVIETSSKVHSKTRINFEHFQNHRMVRIGGDLWTSTSSTRLC